MSESTNSANGPGFGFKAVVFLYALAVVAIGARPLLGNYQGLGRELKALASSIRSESRKIRGATEHASPTVVGKKFEPKSEDPSAAKVEHEKLDKITPKDKEQLDQLLGNL